MNEFLNLCRDAIGAAYVMTVHDDILPYLTDWRRRAKAKALAVLRPANTDEVAALVRLCKQFSVPIVPQGGNTGLVLGSVPDASGSAVVLSLNRLQRIRAIDVANNTITVEAGCVLAAVQQAAAQAQRLFPLSLASEGSCTIGGNLSSNAGGTAVLRYGNARELCLGLEVVTASGDIWHGLRGLRKDNTGYDLRDLFIGAEGTLGIITAAVLKLFPQPTAHSTALVALSSADAAVQLLTLAQQHCAAALTGFELLSQLSMQLVLKHFPGTTAPFPNDSASGNCPYYVLIELSDHESEQHAHALLGQTLSDALARELISDAVIASSLAQAQTLWQLRENISNAQAREGKNIKHDVAVPISSISAFIATTDALLQASYPACRVVCFGHLGDGNLHYNVSAPENVEAEIFLLEQASINRIVHDSVHDVGGSISAEHGLGVLKKDEILRYKSPLEMQMMRAIKSALDPHNLMNPGKIL